MLATFGAFRFDDRTRELRCGDAVVRLSPKAFDLLALLLRARPAAVSKAELHAALWPDTFVSDGNLAVLVAEIRRALGDAAPHSSHIRTVSRFGYAFAATGSAEGSSAQAGTQFIVMWDRGDARLKPGTNVLGRAPDADVCVDGIGVSRRHAAITVNGNEATLTDLSSKNGTFVDGTRVVAPVALHDEVEIRLGGLPLRFRRWSADTATRTIEHATGGPR